MNSFDILSKAVPLQRRLFLEASAGTGKTFTIEHLVIRLLLETDYTLDQILVVTFTRAATRELKVRIRANLERALSLEHKEKLKNGLLTFENAQIFPFLVSRRLLGSPNSETINKSGQALS